MPVTFTFLCDAMLGDLAKTLRLFGHDTMYAGDMEMQASGERITIEDTEILRVARQDGRLVLTKDAGFAARDPVVLLLDGASTREHLAQLKASLGMRFSFNQASSRCYKCNEILKQVNKDEIQGKVGEQTLATCDLFFQCPRCFQVFWQGAHFHDGKGLLSRFEGIFE